MRKIILINIAVLIGMIATANIAAYVALLSWPAPKQALTASNDPRLRYPNVAGLPWASTHFSELNRLQMEYRSFVGWRRKAFAGETIVIGETGIRRSSEGEGNTVALFGGSTMWGTGVRDEDTIASHLNRLGAGWRAVNYGETGYRAHQGYNRLAGELLSGKSFDRVVFYDGVNDVYTGCLAGADVYAHFFDQQFRDIIDYFNETAQPAAQATPFDKTPSPLLLVQPIADLADRLAGRLPESQLKGDRVQAILSRSAAFDCDRDAQRAHAVARMLVQDWIAASELAKRNGAGFVAILQPHAYQTASNVAYLGLEADANSRARLRQQYDVVYPLIRAEAQRAADRGAFRFVDLSTALDRPGQAIYFDFCHVSPNGNAVLAERIAGIIKGDGT